MGFVKERSLSQTILEGKVVRSNESKSRVDRIRPNRRIVDCKDKTSVHNSVVDPSHQSRHDLTRLNGWKVLDRRQKTSRAMFWPRKIDCRSVHEKGLFKMAKLPLYDRLPRNSEIHNFSDVKLTERQSRPSLKSPTAAEFDLQIEDFCRRVRLHTLFADQPQEPNFNPRLYVPTGWNPPREDPDLEDKLFHLREALRRNIVILICGRTTK